MPLTACWKSEVYKIYQTKYMVMTKQKPNTWSNHQLSYFPLNRTKWWNKELLEGLNMTRSMTLKGWILQSNRPTWKYMMSTARIWGGTTISWWELNTLENKYFLTKLYWITFSSHSRSNQLQPNQYEMLIFKGKISKWSTKWATSLQTKNPFWESR